MHFASVHIVNLYSNIDPVTVRKKYRFILSDKSDFHMIDNLSIAVYAFARSTLTSLSEDDVLLSRYVNFLVILEACHEE